MTADLAPVVPPAASPLVSVIVATRNRPDLLQQCLTGIAGQTYSSLEVLVADDGSSCATREAYRTLCPALEGRLRWLLPEHPDSPGTGPAAARNRGIQAASGEYVAFCDDDDRWIRDDHLHHAVAALETSGADFLFTDIVASRNSEPSDHVWFPDAQSLKTGRRVTDSPAIFDVEVGIAARVVGASVAHPDTWVVRRDVLQRVGPFWERLWFGEDYDLLFRILDKARAVLFRADACVDYRLPVGDSVSLSSSSLETTLQEIMAAQHVRGLCRRPEIVGQARAREAWALRKLSRTARMNGNRPEARRLGWQAFSACPTLGAFLSCLGLR
ncbi:MAG: glycosyltransferase family A protein [Vicinamibacterales bacterium]